MQILQVVETLLKQGEFLQPPAPAQLPKSSPAALFLLDLCARVAASSKPGHILRCGLHAFTALGHLQSGDGQGVRSCRGSDSGHALWDCLRDGEFAGSVCAQFAARVSGRHMRLAVGTLQLGTSPTDCQVLSGKSAHSAGCTEEPALFLGPLSCSSNLSGRPTVHGVQLRCSGALAFLPSQLGSDRHLDRWDRAAAIQQA